MNKKEMIKKFGLESSGEKVSLYDGLRYAERVLYFNQYGNRYVFYGNDLYSIKGVKRAMDGVLYGDLGGCYSWYH